MDDFIASGLTAVEERLGKVILLQGSLVNSVPLQHAGQHTAIHKLAQPCLH